jgi:hypothetical protein
MQALARRAAAPIFALALFSSAGLIFVLQPLFARMATPLLGGSPAVWNTSMAFFQAALLVGYLYAHVLARVKDLRVQAGIHIAVLAAAWLLLPVQVTNALGPPSSEHPALWLVGVLTLSVGAPFAAASATAPLLQAWYARTGRADAHDPYYLYAASNLGSFAGLLAYPIFIEPLLGAHAQSAAWSAGYVGVAALIVFAAATALGANGEAPAPVRHDTPAPSWRTRFYWLAAAAVPSALVIGVTQHISTDVASAPMLWVIPLALYLVTFVIAFMKGGARIEPASLIIHPVALALMIASYYASGNWMLSIGGILGGFFFSALICHHALARTRPAADRLTEFYLFVSIGGVIGGGFAAFLAPVIFNNIYEFPLAMAAACLFRPRAGSDVPRLADAAFGAAIVALVVGLVTLRLPPLDSAVVIGALGAAALVLAAGWGAEGRASTYRYVFLAVAALHAAVVIYVAFDIETIFVLSGEGEDAVRSAVQPWGVLLLVSSLIALLLTVHGTIQGGKRTQSLPDIALGFALPGLVLLIVAALRGGRITPDELVVLAIGFCGIAVFLNRGRPVMLAAIVLFAFAAIFLDDARGSRIITQERSFFGVMRTREYDRLEPGVPTLRVLMHGTTIHGAQLVGDDYSRLPLTYYHPQTALGEAITSSVTALERSRLGLIGLGAGSTACLMRPEDQLTIFEIDPAVVRLSTSPDGDFTYVPQCQPNARVVLGDARLRIADEPDAAFDVIVVDAFSSDAIPAHLLTREAIALYLRKTSERGVVVLHLSNRNLALVSEAARVARDLNVPTLYRLSDRFETIPVSYFGGLGASVMILAHTPDVLTSLILPSNDWTVFPAPPGQGWTDDYINIPRALWEGVADIERCRLYPYLRECQTTDAGDAEN